MGCFLTTTDRDLSQMKQRMAQQSRTSQSSLIKQYAQTITSIAKHNPALLPYFLKHSGGKFNYEMGKLGEQVAEKVLEQSMDLKIIQRATAQGVDIKAEWSGQTSVSVEVKTSVQEKSFDKLLGTGYGHKQCSDPWLEAVGIDPEQALVLGVHINPERETVSIYRRTDGAAQNWAPVIRDAPLSRFNL